MKKTLTIAIIVIGLIALISGCGTKVKGSAATPANNAGAAKQETNKKELDVEEEFNYDYIPQFLTDKKLTPPDKSLKNLTVKNSDIDTKKTKISVTWNNDNNSMAIHDESQAKGVKRRVWIYGYSENTNTSSYDFFGLPAYMYVNSKWESRNLLADAFIEANTKDINSGNNDTATISGLKNGLYSFELVKIYSDETISITEFGVTNNSDKSAATNNASKKMFDMLPDSKNKTMTISDQDHDGSIVKRVWIYSYKNDLNAMRVSDFDNEPMYIYEDNNWQNRGMTSLVRSMDTNMISSGNKDSVIISCKQDGAYMFRLISIHSDGTKSSKQGEFKLGPKK